jgi:hypothetical protein
LFLLALPLGLLLWVVFWCVQLAPRSSPACRRQGPSLAHLLCSKPFHLLASSVFGRSNDKTSRKAPVTRSTSYQAFALPDVDDWRDRTLRCQPGTRDGPGAARFDDRFDSPDCLDGTHSLGISPCDWTRLLWDIRVTDVQDVVPTAGSVHNDPERAEVYGCAEVDEHDFLYYYDHDHERKHD